MSKKHGLWDNIHAKRKRGESPASPGDEDYPDEDALEESQVEKSASQDRINSLLKEHGLEGVNKPKMTPNHPKKKAVVLAKEGDTIKLIRFGAKGYKHNYSPEGRKKFKTRHAKNIKRGKLSAAYWADKFLWAGPGGSKKTSEDPKKKKLHKSGLVISDQQQAFSVSDVPVYLDLYKSESNKKKHEKGGQGKGPESLTGEQRGGKYVARVQTGYEKDGSPKYRYFESIENYRRYLENKNRKKREKEDEESDSGDTLREKLSEEQQASSRKTKQSHGSTSLFLKDGNKRSKKKAVKKSFNIFVWRLD